MEPDYNVLIEIVFTIILALVAYVIRGIKSDIDAMKKESVSPVLCLKTHELDAVKIDNLTDLIGRIEEQGKTDQKQTRATLRELAGVVDGLKSTVLEVAHLRRRGDTEGG